MTSLLHVKVYGDVLTLSECIHHINHFIQKISKITRLACGIPAGGDLEYVDDVTLMEAFSGRHKMKN